MSNSCVGRIECTTRPSGWCVNEHPMLVEYQVLQTKDNMRGMVCEYWSLLAKLSPLLFWQASVQSPIMGILFIYMIYWWISCYCDEINILILCSLSTINKSINWLSIKASWHGITTNLFKLFVYIFIFNKNLILYYFVSFSSI